MRAALVLALAATSACGGRRWLERDVPASCRDDYATCQAWAETESRWRSTLAIYDERGLTAYVQSVADRLIRRGGLAIAPRVVLLDGNQGAAAVRSRAMIMVRRDVLAVLDSEAELAAMLAHELVHVSARHLETFTTAAEDAEPTWHDGRVDDEAVADERAVGLLVAAGYPSHAMLDMMRALDRMTLRESPDEVASDDGHPPVPERLARIAAMVATYPLGGDARRAAYLRHLDGLVIGTDPRQGARVGDAWIAVDPGFAIAIGGWEITQDDGYLSGHRGTWTNELAALTISGAYGRLLSARLDERHRGRAGAIRGVMPTDFDRPFEELSPTDRLLESTLSQAWRPDLGAQVAVVDTGDVALLITVTGDGSAALLDGVLASLRAPTRAERAAVHPSRVAIRPAAVAGPRDAVVLATCAAYERSRELIAPDAVITRGELVRCVDPGAPVSAIH